MIRPRRDYDAGHRTIQRQYGGAAPKDRAAPPPRLINLPTVQMLVEPRHFAYRGAGYRIRKMTWLDGLTMEYLTAQIQNGLDARWSRENLQALADHYLDLFALFWRNVEPANPVVRWVWRLGLWRRNPFLTMTNLEALAVAGFFAECRTRLSDLALDITLDSRNAARSRKIAPMLWRSLPNTSRRGATPTENPSVTIT